MRSASRSSSRLVATWPSSGTKTPTKASRRVRNGCRSCSPSTQIARKWSSSSPAPTRSRPPGVRPSSPTRSRAESTSSPSAGSLYPRTRHARSPGARADQQAGHPRRPASRPGLARTGHAPDDSFDLGIQTIRPTRAFAVSKGGDAAVFFGRDVERVGILDRVAEPQSRSILVVAPSGSGERRRPAVEVCCRD